MASNTRPQFKHPIRQTEGKEDIGFITAEAVINAVDADPKLAVVMWNVLLIAIRSCVSLRELQQMTDLILMRCWDGTRYLYELFGYALRRSVIEAYTNVSLPDDPERCYSLICQTDLYQVICEYINLDQLGDLDKAVQLYFQK